MGTPSTWVVYLLLCPHSSCRKHGGRTSLPRESRAPSALPTGRRGSAPGFAAHRRAAPRQRSGSAFSPEPTAPGAEAVRRTRAGIRLGRARGRRLRVRRGSGPGAGGGPWGSRRREAASAEALGAPRACGGRDWSHGAGSGRAREAETALGRRRRGAEKGPGRRGRAAPPRHELGMTLAKSPRPPEPPSRRRRAARVGRFEVLRLRGGQLSEERAVCRAPRRGRAKEERPPRGPVPARAEGGLPCFNLFKLWCNGRSVQNFGT